MSASSFSQTTSEGLFPAKIKYKSFDAYVISEKQMDSINLTYAFLRLKISEEESSRLKLMKLQLKIDQLESGLDLSTLDLSKYRSLYINSEKQNENLKAQLELKQETWNIERDYLKQKARGKFTSFILGTAIGSLIVSLAIIFL
jgi:hypothetical protein